MRSILKISSALMCSALMSFSCEAQQGGGGGGAGGVQGQVGGLDINSLVPQIGSAAPLDRGSAGARGGTDTGARSAAGAPGGGGGNIRGGGGFGNTGRGGGFNNQNQGQQNSSRAQYSIGRIIAAKIVRLGSGGIRPNFARTITPASIGTISRAVGDLAISGVQVTAQSRQVVLRGVVSSESDKRIAARMAMAMPGVKSVDNQLSVQAP